MTESYSLTEIRWAAVQARDEQQAGRFIYAVRSTGIYCRPACPSRRPRRDQVQFFEQPAEARAAGFRPCQRCHPDEQDAQQVCIQQVCSFIEANLDQKLSLATLGAEVGLSPYHLQRTFKKLLGITPRQYIAAQRLQRFKTGLRDGEQVTAAAYDAGYGSASTIYSAAQRFGMAPHIYQQGGKDMHIRYTLIECEAGLALVGATEQGVCAVSLGDDPGQLEAELRREYGAATLERDDQHLRPWGMAISEYLAGQRRELDLPVDVQATAFQWRVWEVLRAIPYGTTRSYGEVARLLGQPTATRAVARACATNQVALVIPCHRVIREDGGLGGYRWGIERKQALLDRERASAETGQVIMSFEQDQG